jgi:MFS family permease
VGPSAAALTILAGAWLAPQVITGFELIPDCAPHGTVTEAYAWGVTATFLGYALGNFIGGVIADNGARPTLLASAGCGALAATFAIGRRRTLQPVS